MIDNESAALKIIKMLNGRGGFDGWWHEIEEEDQKEILIAIENIIGETHDP